MLVKQLTLCLISGIINIERKRKKDLILKGEFILVLYQKNIKTYDMNTMTDSEAQKLGSSFYQIYKLFHQEKIEKNRQKIKKRLDKRLK